MRRVARYPAVESQALLEVAAPQCQTRIDNRVAGGGCPPPALTPPDVRFTHPAVPKRMLWLRLTSAGTSQRVPTALAPAGMPADRPGYDAPAFTLMPAACTHAASVQTLGFRDIGLLTRCVRLCDSCSSGQRFAMGLLPGRTAVALRLDRLPATLSPDLHHA